MSTPLIGALQGLWPLEVADLPRYKAAVTRGQQSGFGNYFPYVLTHQRARRSAVLWCEDDGRFCVFVRRRGERGARLDLLVAPAPMDKTVARRCLERANAFNGDRLARILRIDAKDAALVGAFEQVNDGSDARRPGLRQLKDSLRPVSMHLEYRGSQVAVS